jgi:hypothetical protein
LGVLVFCWWQAIRPRPGFSYGPNPREMVTVIDRHQHKTALLSIADALVVCHEGNIVFLRRKQDWYRRGLRSMVAGVIVVAWLAQTGAVK